MLDHTQMVRGERAPAVYALSGLGRQHDAMQLVHTTGLVLASCAASVRVPARWPSRTWTRMPPSTCTRLLISSCSSYPRAMTSMWNRWSRLLPGRRQSILPMPATRRQHRGQRATASSRATGGGQLSFTRWRSARSISTMRPRGCMEPG